MPSSILNSILSASTQYFAILALVALNLAFYTTSFLFTNLVTITSYLSIDILNVKNSIYSS